MVVKLTKLKSGPKKFQAIFFDDKTKKKTKTLYFGNRLYEDYTQHKDPERHKRYIARHKKREDWSRAGKKTAGFWSKHLLWSKPSLRDAIKVTQGKLGEKIVYRQ